MKDGVEVFFTFLTLCIASKPYPKADAVSRFLALCQASAYHSSIESQ